MRVLNRIVHLLHRDRRHTRTSCLGNAAVAVLLAVFMIVCIFTGGEEYKDSLLYAAGLLALVAVYWVYRWYKFDDQDFNDPLHLRH